MPGYDLTGKPVALAGVIHSDGKQTLTPPGASGSNSDFNDAGTYSFQALSGDYTFGAGNRGTVELTFAPNNGPQVTLNFIFYFVTPSDLYFLEADSNTNTGLPTMFRLAGEVVLQQTNTQFGQSALAGASVATGTGLGTSGDASIFAGLLTSTLCNQNAAVSLAYDENNGGTINGGAADADFLAGTCAITSNGRVSFTGLGTTTAATRVAAAYLTGPGQGFLIGSDAAVTTGRLEQQTGRVLVLADVVCGRLHLVRSVHRRSQREECDRANDCRRRRGTLRGGGRDRSDRSHGTKPGTTPERDVLEPRAQRARHAHGNWHCAQRFPDKLDLLRGVSRKCSQFSSEDTTDSHPQLILLDHWETPGRPIS